MGQSKQGGQQNLNKNTKPRGRLFTVCPLSYAISDDFTSLKSHILSNARALHISTYSYARHSDLITTSQSPTGRLDDLIYCAALILLEEIFDGVLDRESYGAARRNALATPKSEGRREEGEVLRNVQKIVQEVETLPKRPASKQIAQKDLLKSKHAPQAP
ncbi:hypothetical protein E8E11_001979 [Didymella keratinophila]|nr:hypothetical protein E8E11_001979 [Didymella keratinophila]